MNATSSSFSSSSLHSPLLIFTCVLSILTHVAQCLLSLPGRKRAKEDKWGGVASERVGEYGVGRAERRWANDREREREREEKSYPFHLSLSLCSICHKRRDVVGVAAVNLWFLRRFLKLIQRQWQWAGVFLSEAVSADPESVMSVLKRNRHSKRSSDSIYDMLHLVRDVLCLWFFLNRAILSISSFFSSFLSWAGC